MNPPPDPAAELARLRRKQHIWTWVAVAGVILTVWAWFGSPLCRAPASTSPTPSTTSTSIPRSGSWVQTGEWSGATSRTTEDFSVSSSYWKVCWDTRPGDLGPMNFIALLGDATGQLSPNAVANTIGRGADSSFFRAPGQYYFAITALQPYRLRVLELR